ncbi:F-actin-monooxygenase Mical isoform X3 [Tribolium castaneum]|uniref:F-actin-monooxygenase Mical isoform X3 n=1 Tax=Tribolium castaneum TaxID=7070 RepID=UPI0030FECF53
MKRVDDVFRPVEDLAMDHHNQPPPPRGGPQVTAKDVALANEFFDHFLNATSLRNILGYYRSICDLLNLKPNLFPLFYPKLRGYLKHWRANALWKKFDARAAHKCYGKGKLCANSRVLIIGAGPCGLRTAIEAQLLGAKVVVIEKRDRLSRNNVLHLWPFVIEDLRALGAKKFFGKFCAGAIDHISIRQLQCILLKVVLLLGVEVHTEVSFERLVEPDPVSKTGWRAEFTPSLHPVSQYEFDVVIGADGKRNTLQGFKRKEFRGKLAIAITANFINKRTEAEARVEEISGVAFIFNQKFFKDLYEATGIDLENIVYYKDDTHYFVMTAKKSSLIDKGVIKQDLMDTERLLATENVNREALMDYAREAANFSTNYQMPDVEFAVNHYGQPDVAMFDFTSMYAAENASKVVERNGFRLLMILVGDSLLEPFWPTGSGCARGFLSSLDAAWAIRSWCSGTMTPLDVLAERESIYRLLAQTTPDNLNKEWKSYTLDPATRYPNLNKNVVLPLQTTALFDSDDPRSLEKMRRNSLEVAAAIEMPKKRRRGNVDNEVLLNWVAEQVREHDDVVVDDFGTLFKDGKVLCAILNHYRPDLVDYEGVKGEGAAKLNQLAIDILEREIGISPIMTGEELTKTEDYLAMATYLTQVYDSFRCEIPHIKHPKLTHDKLPEPLPLKKQPPSKFVHFDPITEEMAESSYISSSEISQMFHSHSLNIKISPSTPLKKIKFEPFSNTLHLVSRNKGGHVCHKVVKKDVCCKFSCCNKMSDSEESSVATPATSSPDRVYNRVSKWISNHDFHPQTYDDQVETNLVDGITDITSVTKNIERTRRTTSRDDGLVVEERTDVVKCGDVDEAEKDEHFIKNLTKFSQYSPFDKKKRNRTASPSHFSVIVEGEELDLPEPKKSDTSFKSVKQHTVQPPVTTYQPPVPRPSSRHKRHAEPISLNRQSLDRKTRKRRTIEKISASVEERQKILEEIVANRTERQNKRRQQRRLQTEQFLKSMQMLQANAKPDSQPFEDYSLFVYRQTAPNFEDRVKDLERKFTYVPDHENKLPNQTRGNTDEDFAARIKNLEDKWREPQPAEKKPKDLLRAIGKIETSDWNIKEIEKKIRENKLGKPANKDKEKVPKWSKEQFKARQTKMEKQHLDRQDSAEAKFADIDKNIKHLELKLKEGTARDLGQNKVASITEKFASKPPENADPKPLQKSQSRPVILPSQNASEFCHFCNKRVYLMERLSAEGRFFHHGCFKCQYCYTQLRLGSYAFDRDGIYDHKFFCIHHYGMQGELRATKVIRKPSQRHVGKSPEKKPLSGIAGVDLLDRVRTPERVEFANLSGAASDHEESLSQMDEDEWTDKNFGASAAELGSSDDESSSLSGSDSDDEDAYEEALEEPATKEGTLKWAERLHRRYSKKRDYSDSDDYSSSDRSSYYENSSDDDETDTATEGEEEIRARELRKQEVRVEPPVVQTDTGTDTEVVSDESTSTSTSSEIRNSATEISTDSEFAHDDPTPTRETPFDAFVTKHRGGGGSRPRKIQVTASYLQRPTADKAKAPELKLTPLVPSAPSIVQRCIAPVKTDGYALNRTQSTGGIAAKVSLELKKKYLLGETNPPGTIQKSGSASTLDTKLKSFHSNITDCQKMLKPAPVTTAPVKPVIFEHEPEGRPRSPVHETSIIVPTIDWSKHKPSDSDHEPETPEFKFDVIPTVLIEETPKITKTLNQPKLLPELEPNILPEIHDVLHVKRKLSIETESEADANTAALTETELSDWARDGAVSDDLDDDFTSRSNKKPKMLEGKAKIAESHVCGKETTTTEAVNSVLCNNLDIEFMDTGTETSSDDAVGDSQDGYVLFKDEDELVDDSLNIVEARNTGYCIIDNAGQDFGGTVIDLKPADLEQLKAKQTNEHDEDSLLIVEGTTTEENTCSDSTVKNLTEIAAKDPINNNNFQRKRLEDKLAQLKAEKVSPPVDLKPKYEFSNAKDSIDVRKSRRRSKPDLIQEDKETTPETPFPVRTPDVIYKKEFIEKERDVNQKLVQEMVMNKMKAENKSLERRRRKSRQFDLTETNRTDSNNRTATTPDVLLSTLRPLDTTITTTPVAPPRLKHEKLKEDARLKARLLSNEELGLSPEDKLVKLREKLGEGALKRSQSREDAKIEREKPIKVLCKSDPNLLETDEKKGKKKKDRERRKSFTKILATFFTKKSPTGFLAKISPKTKDVSKEVVVEEQVRRNSFSGLRDTGTPPPVPPLPLNYTGNSIKDDSSDGERLDRSSCDTLDKSGTLDSVSSNNRQNKSARKAARQAQLKRHRMAQEIQRKLEETEVKTRELEERGVLVEKALRGEVDGRCAKEESELLQEWFDLMRDRTELRRYERELMVRAQEVELEDRHARLQHELRERLENTEEKTGQDVDIESSIIKEMMDIVAKRDSLIALLEEDRLRYSNEDRDFEEQVLAKGLRLTPIRKTPEK